MSELLAYWQPLAVIVLLGLVFTKPGRRAGAWLAAAIFWHLPRWAWRQYRRRRPKVYAPHERDPRDFTPQDRAEVFARAGFQCEEWVDGPLGGHRCPHRHGLEADGEVQTLQADHVVARALGGPTELDNAQALCRICNRRKSDALVDAAYCAALVARRRDYWPTRRIPNPAKYLAALERRGHIPRLEAA